MLFWFNETQLVVCLFRVQLTLRHWLLLLKLIFTVLGRTSLIWSGIRRSSLGHTACIHSCQAICRPSSWNPTTGRSVCDAPSGTTIFHTLKTQAWMFISHLLLFSSLLTLSSLFWPSLLSSLFLPSLLSHRHPRHKAVGILPQLQRLSSYLPGKWLMHLGCTPDINMLFYAGWRDRTFLVVHFFQSFIRRSLPTSVSMYKTFHSLLGRLLFIRRRAPAR